MRPSIPEVIDRFLAYYSKPENGAWGSLHIVLEDSNIEDSSVQFCIDYAVERGDAEGTELGRVLLTMSKTQRRKLPGAIHRILYGRKAA